MKSIGEDSMNRRKFLAATAAVSAAGVTGAIAQVGTTPVKIVLPFGAGGGGDALSRLMAEKIAAAIGRPVIVENKTGADGRIGIQSVKNAAPDGDTFLITTGPTMWLYPLTHPSPGYDPFADFVPIAQLARFEFCVAVANNTGLKTMAELAAWVKANPDKAAYGVPGAGTIPHFTGVGLAKHFGVDMRRVPYRGGAPAMIDLVAGQIPIVVGTLADALQQHRGGTVRIIGVTSKVRSPFVPDVPTLIESGFNLTGDAWYGLWAPAKTPAEAVAKINAAVTATLADEAVKKRLETLGLIPAPSTPEGLTAVMKSDQAFWAEIVKASGFRME
jgi:tripartite-type tricarboxylate transporter receptor subunit TctC